MPKQRLAHITTWVFDLDNTLYPPHMALFDQIEARMEAFISQHLGITIPEARALRKTYWAQYGTTLAGLSDQHGVDPVAFLEDVHDIDFTTLSKDHALGQAIAALPGRKIVYTNGDIPYARKVLQGRGFEGLFDQVYGIESADFVPKPQRIAYETVFAREGLEPERAVMFEDDARNLKVPHEMGMATVHIHPEKQDGAHIAFHDTALDTFLHRLQGETPPPDPQPANPQEDRHDPQG